MLINLDNSDILDLLDNEIPLTITINNQIRIEDLDIVDKLYHLYIENMWIRVVKKNKNITTISNKLEEMHTNM